MADFLTYPQLFRIARDEVLGRNSRLRREIIERAGSDANAIIASGVSVADEVSGQIVRLNADLFLDSAREEALERLVFDRYGITRKGASSAVTVVEFSTTSPVGAGFSIPVDSSLSTDDNKKFRTTSQATFPTGSSGPISVPVASVLAGLNQQVAANTVTTIRSAISGAPSDLVVTNPLASAGADDEESDTSLRDRARQFYTTQYRGTLKAIRQGILAVPGVRTCEVFESITSGGQPARIVEAVIADAFTQQLVNATTTPASYATQSQQFALDVIGSLSDVRAAGIQVSVTVGVVTVLGVTLLLRFRTGYDIPTVTTQAKVNQVNFCNSLSPGDSWIRAAAETSLQAVDGLEVLGGEIIQPLGDVTAGQLEVLRTSLDFVTAAAEV